MKKWHRHVLTGMMACTVLLGTEFAALGGSAAYADQVQTTSAGASAPDMPQTKDRRGGHFDAAKELSLLLGMDQSTIMSDLQNGETMVQIAAAKDMAESELLQKLVDAATSEINSQVQAGSLTQDEAAQEESGLSDRLKEQIEAKGFGPGRTKSPDGSQGGPGGGYNLLQEAAGVLGVSQQALDAKLRSGDTLSAIAESQGLTEDVFLQKLETEIASKIDTLVSSGKMTETLANQIKNGLSAQLKKQIETAMKIGAKPDATLTSGSSAKGSSSGSSTVTLTDIKGHWAESAILDLVKKGVLSGDPNHHFNPDQAVTREQLAAMIANAFHLQAGTVPSGGDFADVPESRWSFGSVEAAKPYMASFKNSQGKAIFEPAEGAKRADVAVTLVKVLLKQNASLQLMNEASATSLLKGKFKDWAAIPAVQAPYIAVAVREQLIGGDNQGDFAPQKTITRAEVAVLLDRMLNKSS